MKFIEKFLIYRFITHPLFMTVFVSTCSIFCHIPKNSLFILQNINQRYIYIYIYIYIHERLKKTVWLIHKQYKFSRSDGKYRDLIMGTSV